MSDTLKIPAGRVAEGIDPDAVIDGLGRNIPERAASRLVEIPGEERSG